ncbi:MAG: 7-carboxy-7-deazaguanine synthase QueE [Novosphingobium sp.]|nr:7-carboxy-7-deazaguanine synthase QueE [Novosphingobium sp.]
MGEGHEGLAALPLGRSWVGVNSRRDPTARSHPQPTSPSPLRGQGCVSTLATITPGEPEIFVALQGEGPSAGQPCAFVRLSRCNLACVWCDTAYTWRFESDTRPHRDGINFDRSDNQFVLAEPDVAERIGALGQKRLVVTGGEPLLQAAALARMLALLPPMTVEIETNGTISPPSTFDRRVAQYNVSPKLAHSGNPAALALLPDRLARWAAEPRAFFKFVIAEPADLAEVLELRDRFALPPERIFLMPEGRNSGTLRTRAVWLSELCSKYEFNLSDRLHIYSHGDTRGT